MTIIDAWTPEEGARRVTQRFVATYAEQPEVVTLAPGRVNLIGEHTDYNEGLCLPIALAHATYAAARDRDDGVVRLVSARGPVWSGGLEGLHQAQGWAAYAAGVVWALREAGHQIGGLDVAIAGCVPLGAGLSSSAALECSVATAVAALLGLPDDEATRLKLVRAGIRAENEVAGAATGGMDQTVAELGRAGHALLLDCRTWQTRQVPFDPGAAGLTLLVVDTRVHHALNDGGYASRRTDCEQAATTLGLDSLRDATEDDVEGIKDDRVRRRARHVVTEIARVSEAAAAFDRSDWSAAGELMGASHASMRDDFEISCPELDAVVEVTTREGAVGARLTGGGFGGSAIALVPGDRLEATCQAVDAAFEQRGWRAPAYLVATASDAAHVLTRC